MDLDSDYDYDTALKQGLRKFPRSFALEGGREEGGDAERLRQDPEAAAASLLEHRA